MKKLIFLFCLLFSNSAFAEKMIILKGIKNLLDVESAKTTAIILGYEPIVLKSSGENYYGNPQVKEAIQLIKNDSEITAIYGFSGGGYNTRNLFKILDKKYKNQIKKIVILGSPGVTKNDFVGVSEIDIIPDSPKGHMNTPKWWLEKLDKSY